MSEVTQNNIKKFEQLLSLITESLTRAEFLSAFENIVKQVLEIEKKVIQNTDKKTDSIFLKLQELYQEYENNLGIIKEENIANLEKFKKLAIEQIESVFIKNKITEKTNIINEKSNTILEIHADKIKEFDKKLAGIRNGKDADEEKIVADVLNQIPPVKEETPIEIKQKLETLKGSERLDKKAINGLEDEIKKLKAEIEIVKKLPRGKLGGMRKIPIVRAIDLSADVDGTVTTFNLPRDTVRVLGVWSTQFPITFRIDTDFTLSGNTLTLVQNQVGIIQSGQTLHCLIETLFYA